MKTAFKTFFIFAIIVMACRHIVTDIRQEERITVLENMVTNLQDTNLHALNSYTQEFSAKPKAQAVTHKASNHKPKSKPTEAEKADSVKERSLATPSKSQKFSNPILLELNVVDSATLVKVPGIGEKSASIILRYREQLGGFCSPRQISEKLTWESATERMDEWCSQWFKTNPQLIKKLNVNHTDFRQLLRHPYLEYEQVKALVRYRDRHNGIPSIAVLKMLEEFSDKDIERLEPYLEF